jgi:hypothetical protein
LKDVLTLYRCPYDPLCPTVCFDEKSLQLLADSRLGSPPQPGRPGRRDYEYVRQGTRNIFLFVEPHTGQRHVLVTLRRTKEDFAKAMRYLMNELYPLAKTINLVNDNLNTHTAETIIEVFGKSAADPILSRLVFHYTPLHASWVNIAEIELSALTTQCLNRRIPDEWTLATELIACEKSRNLKAEPIRWSFTWRRAKRLFCKPEASVIACSTMQN